MKDLNTSISKHIGEEDKDNENEELINLKSQLVSVIFIY